MSNFWNRLLFTLSCCCMVFLLSAQEIATPTSNSPYSRLGLGDLLDQNFAASAAMGGLSATYHDPFHLNILNPASYASLRSTAFEVGLTSEYTRLNNGENTSNEWDGNLSYMALGFPMRNPINEALDRRTRDFGWGMGLALTPYSRVSYDILTTSTLIDTISTINSFQGNGGTYRLNWGTGVRYKNLSVGATLGYIFGKINNQRRIELQDAGTHYTNNFVDAFSISGTTWNIGVIYDWVLKSENNAGELAPNGKKVTFGAHFNAAQSFTTNISRLYQRIYSVNIGTIASKDSLPNLEDEKRKGKLPSEFTLGIQYVDANKLRLGFNYTLANWSEYTNPAQTLGLSNAYKASVGLEYIPDHASYNKYLKRVRYRIGAFYSKDPRSFDSEQLTHYALTLGMGMPVVLPRQGTSFVNVALEAGQFGLPDALQETYVKLTLGFTLNDNTWFFKQKFN